jgi:hypothetical protein
MTRVLGGSMLALLAVGVACGVAAVIGWHVAMGLDLAADLDRTAWRTVLDLIWTDLGAFATAGVLGSVCGWAGQLGGVIALATSLAGACLVVAALAAWLSPSRAALLIDDDIVLHDVVQSALLDLPASKLPGDL